MNVLQPDVIRVLAEHTTSGASPVLSVYLDLDPSNPVNRRGGYKLALDGILKDIEAQISEEYKLRHFKEDAEWIRQKVEFHLPKGKSVMLCCDVSESFYFEEDLPIRMANQGWFGSSPYLRPFIQAWHEFERYGVVLVDRERARFFVIGMGNIEEVSDLFQDSPVKHRAMAGSDHMRSQMILQRRAATWSGWFLKDVSEMLHDTILKYDIDRILLAGPEDVSAELQRLLPKAVASRVVDRLKISVTAKAGEVLDVCFPVIAQLEKEQEAILMHDLITTAQKTGRSADRAALGLNATLDAINQSRVYRLLYPSGVKIAGFRCATCDVLLDHSPADGKCPYCSNTLEEVEDMTWLASERVLAMGGRIEEIRSPEANAQLIAAGGLGAFLR